MLNNKNERELAYVVSIDAIEPIEGADNVEIAKVLGWRVMVRKGQFSVGDLAVYFEIDSRVPEDMECFSFLAAKHYKVKTQKYFKGTVISQGLLMSFSDFGWENNTHKLGDFLTKELGVTYSSEEDNQRKSNVDKYKLMAKRKEKLFAKQPFKWLMKRAWGREILFFFFGKKRDKKSQFPTWVKKTDEERCQNQPWRFPGDGKTTYIATEKIDGTSTTFTMKKGKFGKVDFRVCSRNVSFSPDNKKECYYDSNYYLEMAKKYNIKTVLTNLFKDHFSDCEWVTIQGETYGDGVQKRTYGLLEERKFAAFNLITSKDGRINSVDAAKILKEYGIDWVPIVDENFLIPNSCDELLAIAEGKSMIDGGMREGLVIRSKDGKDSFKAVSNAFLIKYHG